MFSVFFIVANLAKGIKVFVFCDLFAIVYKAAYYYSMKFNFVMFVFYIASTCL